MVKNTWRASADDINGIQYVLEEHFMPGQPVQMLLGLGYDLTGEQVDAFGQYLTNGGLQLLSPIKMVHDSEWGPSIFMEFKRPVQEGVGFAWAIPLLFVGGLAAIGVTAFIGWQVGEVLGQIARYLVPVALIAAGTYLVAQLIKGKQGAAR